MPLAFLLIFGGALLVYMGWKNESFTGILNDTLDPISHPTQDQGNFASGQVTGGITGAIDPGIAAASGAIVGSTRGYFRNWIIGRTDQGVDMNPRGGPGTPLPAIGTSKVVGVIPNWYQGQPYVWLQALSGPLKGRYYYYAEQITNIQPVGTILQNGQTVATYAGSGTGVEAGLATATGSTLARATGGYTEGQATPAGKLFRQLIGLPNG